METLIRASRLRLRSFCLLVVENRTVSPSRSIQTIEDCGPPSAFRVAIEAKFRPSST
jgi:hypothetical protein